MTGAQLVLANNRPVEIDSAAAELCAVEHGSLVIFDIRLPESSCAAFATRLNDAGQGRVGWMQDGQR